MDVSAVPKLTSSMICQHDVLPCRASLFVMGFKLMSRMLYLYSNRSVMYVGIDQVVYTSRCLCSILTEHICLGVN